MYKLYYDDNGEEVYVGDVFTNQSLTIDEMLDLIMFDEDSFKREHGFDEIEYDLFFVRFLN